MLTVVRFIRLIVCLLTIAPLVPASRGAAAFEVLRSFNSPLQGPGSRLVADSDGNLYGTALGGPRGFVGYFKVSPAGEFTALHQYASSLGYAHLLVGSDGAIYTTASGGGVVGEMFSPAQRSGSRGHGRAGPVFLPSGTQPGGNRTYTALRGKVGAGYVNFQNTNLIRYCRF